MKAMIGERVVILEATGSSNGTKPDIVNIAIRHPEYTDVQKIMISFSELAEFVEAYEAYCN